MNLWIHISPMYGLIWVRLNGNIGWQIKAPWCPKLFSERYGYKSPVARLFGWRIFRLGKG